MYPYAKIGFIAVCIFGFAGPSWGELSVIPSATESSKSIVLEITRTWDPSYESSPVSDVSQTLLLYDDKAQKHIGFCRYTEETADGIVKWYVTELFVRRDFTRRGHTLDLLAGLSRVALAHHNNPQIFILIPEDLQLSIIADKIVNQLRMFETEFKGAESRSMYRGTFAAALLKHYERGTRGSTSWLQQDDLIMAAREIAISACAYLGGAFLGLW